MRTSGHFFFLLSINLSQFWKYQLTDVNEAQNTKYSIQIFLVQSPLEPFYLGAMKQNHKIETFLKRNILFLFLILNLRNEKKMLVFS